MKMDKEKIIFLSKVFWQFVWKRSFKILMVLITIFFLFEKRVNYLLNAYIVEPVFSQFEFSFRSDVIIVFFNAAIVAYLLYLLYRKHKIFNPPSLIITAVGVFYFYYRFIDSSKWFFYPFTFSDKIYYADSILVLFFISIFLSIRDFVFKTYIAYKKLEQSEQINESRFFLDEVWNKNHEDLMKRHNAAKKLASEIKRIHSKQAVGIGICGEWGSGKSSFLVMIKDEMNSEKDLEVIEFNPWRSASPSLIISDFFETVKQHLSKYNTNASNEINKYVRKLSKYDKTSLTDLYFDFVTEDENLGEQFLRVNDIIKSLDKKILIIIDDVDRLDKKEVIEILKLIRNTANFHNTVFLVAYDREYVINAIEGINDHRKEYYLEKIFQIEVSLPSAPESLIIERLVALLIEKFPDRKTEINFTLKPIFENSNFNPFYSFGADDQIIPAHNAISLVNEFIKSLRDVYRLCNSMALNYSQIEYEVDFEEYLCMEILKSKRIDVYEGIKNKTLIRTSQAQNNFADTFYILAHHEFDKQFLKEGQLSISDNCIKTVLTNVFSEKARGNRSINTPSFFPLYFSNQLFNNISLGEFIEARKRGFDVLKQYINQAISKNLIQELVSLFYSIHDYDNKNDFEAINKCRFYILSRNIDYDYRNMAFHFSNSALSSVTSFYSDIEECKKLLETWISDFSPSTGISSFLYFIGKEQIYNTEYGFILPADKVKELALYNFQEYLNLPTPSMEEVFRYYFNCIDNIDDKHIIHLTESASKLMKAFAEKETVSYLDHLIRDVGPDEFALSPWVNDTFGDYQKFEEFLIQKKDLPMAAQVRIFYDKFRANKYKPIQWPVKEMSYFPISLGNKLRGRAIGTGL